MKNYFSLTSAYLAAAGLVRVYVKCAATGRKVLRQVSRSEAERIAKAGRIWTDL